MKFNETTPLENNKYLFMYRQKDWTKNLTNYNNKIRLTVTIAPTR